MMHGRLTCRICPIVVVLLAAFATGCGSSPPTRFYVLTTIEDQGTGGDPSTSSVSIGVGPVSLPSYLDRPQMITRSKATDIELAEFHHWAEPLVETFTRVLGENLSELVSTDRVYLYPWGMGALLDYEVSLDVTQFEMVGTGEAKLTARWTLVRRGGGTIAQKKSHYTVPTSGDDYSNDASALSKALENLSAEIAEVIKRQ